MIYRNATLQVETLDNLCNDLRADDKYFLLNGVSYVTSLFHSSLFLSNVSFLAISLHNYFTG